MHEHAVRPGQLRRVRSHVHDEPARYRLRVLLAGLSPTAVDVCPSVNLALTRLDAFTPDLIIVNLPEPDASEAVRRLFGPLIPAARPFR
mgnify:CR=1 FL=1